ncbi:C-type natriuretic peptide 2-like [Aulostomus maculatus]
MAASSSSFFVPVFVLFLTAGVESRPSPGRDDMQVLNSLFGAELSSLIMAPPPSDDITEGSSGRLASSASSPSPSPSSPSPSSLAGLTLSRGAVRGLASRREAVPQFFLDFLRQRSKMRRRSRKSMVGGGRGCFGMRMDRIGSLSGLGC